MCHEHNAEKSDMPYELYLKKLVVWEATLAAEARVGIVPEPWVYHNGRTKPPRSPRSAFMLSLLPPFSPVFQPVQLQMLQQLLLL